MNSNLNGLNIRFATKADITTILEFIRALAEYENLAQEVEATEALLEEFVFNRKGAEVIIANFEGEDVGFALFFHNFSTFLGRSGIYIEDLFVSPKVRGKGIGKALITYVARLANERGCGRLEWACLDWNTPSINFYKSLGAVPMDEWTTYRVTGQTIKNLGQQ